MSKATPRYRNGYRALTNRFCSRIVGNKTRQGYARKRTLKLAGYFLVGCFA
jgi:hypothetical protein